MAASMWSIPNVSNIPTPLSIMREQGNQLAMQTGYTLTGHAGASGGVNQITNDFTILVPALNNYSYLLARYDQQPDAIFPGYLSSALMKESKRINNITEFQEEFSSLLKSERTFQLLTSLLAQAHALSNV